MKKKASMTYLGPCGVFEDPTSENVWQQGGEALEVDMETAWRLLRLPLAQWETDAPPPPPLPEESEEEEEPVPPVIETKPLVAESREPFKPSVPEDNAN